MKNVNTVVLDLNEYNELRDFRRNIEGNHTFSINYLYGGGCYVHTWDDAVEQIAKINEDLAKEIDNLKHPKKKELSISEIKDMSVWKFLKWKSGNLKTK